MPDLVLPAAMVEAAAQALYVADKAINEGYADRVGHWQRTAAAVLNAALAGSVVREEWGSVHDGCEHWGHIRAAELPEGWLPLRRLVITMPATVEETQ